MTRRHAILFTAPEGVGLVTDGAERLEKTYEFPVKVSTTQGLQ